MSKQHPQKRGPPDFFVVLDDNDWAAIEHEVGLRLPADVRQIAALATLYLVVQMRRLQPKEAAIHIRKLHKTKRKRDDGRW
jgi:hypothetical protein